MACILIIGGAGYIGSHVNLMLGERKYPTVVLDNLSKGHRWAVLSGEMIHGDMADQALLGKVFRDFQVDTVMHFSAFSIVEESVGNPLKYYRNNIANAIKLLEVMVEHGVKNIVFSSSAAVYGEPKYVPIDEDHPPNPTNPYGRTKLGIEGMLKDCDRAYGLRHVSLRYFNAAGADEKGRIGEDHAPETHLIPKVLKVAKLTKNRSNSAGNREVEIYGTDYDTPDGTCIRDYVHVTDLAEAHVMAVEYLRKGGESRTYNLGSGMGYSVKEIMKKIEEVTGVVLPIKECPRRPGDPARLLAGLGKISREWNWQPKRDLAEIIGSAWIWETHHSNI
jgi:UDP-glucose 4-epimerase